MLTTLASYGFELIYIIFHKINGYIEDHDNNKYLGLIPHDKNNDMLKIFDEKWNKVKYHIKLKYNNANDYDDIKTWKFDVIW